MAAVIAECMSESVDATTRAVNVEALNSCSAYRISDTSIALASRGVGGFSNNIHSMLPASDNFGS